MLLPEKVRAVLPQDIVVRIPGSSAGVSSKVHMQCVISENADLSAPVVDLESKDAQTAWTYWDGVAWQAWPGAGVIAWLETLPPGDPDGDPYYYKTVPRGLAGYEVKATISATLVTNKTYYVGVRQYDIDAAEYSTEYVPQVLET